MLKRKKLTYSKRHIRCMIDKDICQSEPHKTEPSSDSNSENEVIQNLKYDNEMVSLEKCASSENDSTDLNIKDDSDSSFDSDSSSDD